MLHCGALKKRWLGAWSDVVKWWQGSDVIWKVRNTRNFVLRPHHCGGGAVSPVSERRNTGCVCESLLRPTSGRRLAGIGELRESVEDSVALGHAGLPERGLYEQAPRATAPFLSADFPRFGWRRHWRTAAADS